jgi:hypothetical protein
MIQKRCRRKGHSDKVCCVFGVDHQRHTQAQREAIPKTLAIMLGQAPERADRQQDEH